MGRCPTTTENQGAVVGIVEKEELVKKNYRTVLEAWDKVKVCCRHKDVPAQNISVSEICTTCGLCF